MKDQKHLVLLVGSPKGKGGTSGSIGEYILGKLSSDITHESFHVGKVIRKKDAWNHLLSAVDNADIIILSFPLYWDSLPSHLIKGLELVREHNKKSPSKKKQKFYTIVNNGFPEPWHNEIAIEICRKFCSEMGFRWNGALNIGGGAAVDGKPLEETGGMTRRLRETLDMAAKVINRGDPVHKEIEERLAKPLYPPWINLVFGGISWRHQARKSGAKTSVRSKPYQR